MRKDSLFLSLLIAVLITAQLSCGRFGGAKSGPSPTPSPGQQAEIEQILKRYEDAIGGTEAIDSVTSYRLKGTFQVSNMTGRMEVFQKNKNKKLTVIEFPYIGTLKKGFDGETAWVQSPVGTFTHDDSSREIAEMERDSEVYSASRIKSQFESMKLENKGRLSGRTVHIIEGKPVKGPAEKLLFDVESGLLLRWDMARRHPQTGTVFVKVHLEDYRQVGKLKVPFKIRFLFESGTFTVNFDEVQHNVAIDDAIFKKP